MDFFDKSAIVIGGLGGIGKEICISLAERGLKKLCIIDMQDDSVGKSFSMNGFKDINYMYRKCSVTDEIRLRRDMTYARDAFGHLNFIINAVGIINEAEPKLTIDINFGGVVSSTLIGIELLRKDRGMFGGTIVNIASNVAFEGCFMLPIYTGTKHAILGFTRSFQNEVFLKKTGVKFITVCPGATNTSLVRLEEYKERFIFQDMLSEALRCFTNDTRQEPSMVGKCVITALEDGENGSTWRCENSQIEKMTLPEYQKM